MTAEGDAAHVAVRSTTSLLINVSTLLQEPIGSLRHYEVEGARGVGLDAGVNGSLRLLRTDQSVLATALLRTSVNDICGSCLKDIELAVEMPFDEEFWPPADAVSGLPIEPPPERIGFAVIDGQIDLSEAVRQYVEMERPMSPRCGPECPGLESSTSTDAPVDTRWSALTALNIDDSLGESEGD